MSGTYINAKFPADSDDAYELSSVMDNLSEQRSDIAWKLLTSDDDNAPVEFNSSYMSSAAHIVVATEEIVKNRWFWTFNSEWNYYNNEEDGAGVQIEFRLHRDSVEFSEILKWLNIFHPHQLEIESTDGLDPDDMS